MSEMTLEKLKELREFIAPGPWYTSSDRFDDDMCDCESCDDCYCDDDDEYDDLIVNQDGQFCTWGHQLRLRVEGAAKADKEAICALPAILDAAIAALEAK